MYRQLSTSPTALDTVSDDCEKDMSTDGLKRDSSTWFSPRLCFLLCAFCTLLNLTISLSLSPNSVYPLKQPLTRKDIALLRRPSQFIRFNEINRPSPPESKKFNNYPILLAQIDSRDKRKVFPDDTRQYMSHEGTISPEDRRVLVTETISTIIQLRAIDWGMEICELRLSLPASFSAHNSTSFHLLPSQSLPLSLYRIGTTLPLDASTLSYTTRPQRIAKVGNVHFAPGDPSWNGTLWHRKFACKEEDVLSFELACADEAVAAGQGDACRIEWWQNREHPDPAIYMTQYSTN